MTDLLSTPIEYLKGVGPQRAATLQTELGIFSFRDILNHFPFRYQDRSVFHEIRDIHLVDNYLQLKGKITYMGEVGTGRHRKLTARFEDNSGTVDLIWFQGIQWVKANLRVGETYLLFGKPKAYNQNWTIPHPELTKWGEQSNDLGLQAMYPSTEKLNAKGLNAKGIGKIIQGLLPQIKHQIPEVLPSYLTEELHLISKEQAYFSIHAPKNEVEFKQARYRLKFEELFFLQLELLLRKEIRAKKMKGFIFSELGGLFNTFYTKHLPFELTNAQKRVLKEIRKDFLHGEHMNRLLQGDVGSGKTLVALLTILMGIDNGFQGALMAPTEILATQHYESLRELVGDLPIEIALLTGSTKKARRAEIHEGLQNGSIQLLIGTHALLEDVVQFANLGIVVIDEQHRFGVAQRSKMWGKNSTPPHVLIMTATPIPRTLAMTFYGDLDVSIIDELPPGRKPIQTIHRRENHRPKLLQFIKEQISIGRQIYIVYPLIQESEKLDFKNLQEGYELITEAFPSPQYQVSMVHGKLKPIEKDVEMQRFVKAETQIMVATTVIEVGVNVPNASVMVIESAERFGLSQLHQLRGRVGRGAEKSFCILMTGDKLSKESMKRMDTMVMTNDGFQISEVDLQLRGPGDLMGTQQSGVLDLKLADLSRDGQIVSLAREKAREILEKDPDLILPENLLLNQRMRQVLKSRPNWGRIA
ncbi:MAG: ATP-dependent helicase RecG [Bacteroidota bacterium]|jgi:ATP-dependent DNA helicase RecG